MGAHSLQYGAQLSNLHQRNLMSIQSKITTYIITVFGRGVWEIWCTVGAQ